MKDFKYGVIASTVDKASAVPSSTKSP